MSLSAAEAPVSHARKLVWFSEVQWDFLSTRKQRLFARFPAEWQILFVEPYALGRKHHWLPVKRGRVWVVTVPFLKTVPFRIGRILEVPFVRAMVAFPGLLLLHLWFGLLGFASRHRVIGLSNLYWGKIAASLPALLKVYDANDDHLAFPGTPSWLAGYRDAYLAKIRLLFSVSPELTALLDVAPTVRTVALGNGVDFDHFSRHREQVPAPLAALQGPLIGYAGAMDWVDTPLLAAVARAWPSFQFVLVGPAFAHGWWEQQHELRRLQNVHYFGLVDYAVLPEWIQHFDVALLPLVADPLKRVSHPNKLYEYAAAGVPMVATAYCSAVLRAAGQVHVAESTEAFVRLIPEALADRRVTDRQSFARAHDWNSLAAVMVASLESLITESAV